MSYDAAMLGQDDPDDSPGHLYVIIVVLSAIKLNTLILAGCESPPLVQAPARTGTGILIPKVTPHTGHSQDNLGMCIYIIALFTLR